MKRGLILGLLSLLLLSSLLLISAAETTPAPLNNTLFLPTSALGGEIHIYSPIRPGVGFVLGIDASSSISVEELIVRIALWVAVFMLVLGILDFSAFETDWVKYTIGFAIMMILAATGFMVQPAKILFSITKSIQGWNRLWVVLGAVAIMLLLAIARRIMTRQRRLSQADARGTMAGATIKNLNKMAEKTLSSGKKL
jgi:hypothetical protein